MAFHWNRPLSELNITQNEMNQALAYLQIEPPENGANHRAAALMAQIANWSGKTLKKGKSVSASDYIGKPEPPPKPQTVAEQKAILMGLTRNTDG